jgi:hypothetical protein
MTSAFYRGDECIDRWIEGWMNEWINVWMNEWMSVWVSEWVNKLMNEWWMNEWMNGRWSIDPSIHSSITQHHVTVLISHFYSWIRCMGYQYAWPIDSEDHSR